MNFKECLTCLKEDWQNLNETGKTMALQTLENHIAEEEDRYPCMIKTEFLHSGPDYMENGYYSNDDKLIHVNKSLLENTSEYGKDCDKAIKTVLHEGRHAYQHQAADGYLDIKDSCQLTEWKENLQEGHYVTFQENPRAYWEQPVEADARNFAETRCEELTEEYEHIRDYSYEQEACQIFEAQMNSSESSDRRIENTQTIRW